MLKTNTSFRFFPLHPMTNSFTVLHLTSCKAYGVSNDKDYEQLINAYLKVLLRYWSKGAFL